MRCLPANTYSKIIWRYDLTYYRNVQTLCQIPEWWSVSKSGTLDNLKLKHNSSRRLTNTFICIALSVTIASTYSEALEGMYRCEILLNLDNGPTNNHVSLQYIWIHMVFIMPLLLHDAIRNVIQLAPLYTILSFILLHWRELISSCILLNCCT